MEWFNSPGSVIWVEWSGLWKAFSSDDLRLICEDCSTSSLLATVPGAKNFVGIVDTLLSPLDGLGLYGRSNSLNLKSLLISEAD